MKRCGCDVCYLSLTAAKLFGLEFTNWYNTGGFLMEGGFYTGTNVDKFLFMLHNTHLGILISYVKFKLNRRNNK